MALNIIVEDSKHCTPCKTKDKKIDSKYYCTDCEAYYCEECFELHPRVPYLAKHIVLKHDDIAVWSKLQYKCTTHDKNLEFFCGKHKMLCCHVCVSLTHRSCVGMEYILESAKNICAKDEIRTMLQRTQKELENIDLYEGKFEVKAEKNLQSKSGYLEKLEVYTKKLMEMIDLLKSKTLDGMIEKFEANKKYSDEMVEKLKTFKKELNDLKHQLTTATAEKEVLIFISLKRGENTIEDIKRELSEMDTSTNKEIFNPKFDNGIESFLKNIENIACLEDEQMRQELVSSEDFDLCTKETLTKQNEKDSAAITYKNRKDKAYIDVEKHVSGKPKSKYYREPERDAKVKDEIYESKYSKKESCPDRENNIFQKTESKYCYDPENDRKVKDENCESKCSEKESCLDREYSILERTNSEYCYMRDLPKKVKDEDYESKYSEKESCLAKEYGIVVKTKPNCRYQSEKTKKDKDEDYESKYSEKESWENGIFGKSDLKYPYKLEKTKKSNDEKYENKYSRETDVDMEIQKRKKNKKACAKK